MNNINNMNNMINKNKNIYGKKIHTNKKAISNNQNDNLRALNKLRFPAGWSSQTFAKNQIKFIKKTKNDKFIIYRTYKNTWRLVSSIFGDCGEYTSLVDCASEEKYISENYINYYKIFKKSLPEKLIRQASRFINSIRQVN